MFKLNTNGKKKEKKKNMQVSNRLAGNLFPERLGCLIMGGGGKFFATDSFLQNLISQGIYLLGIKFKEGFCLHFATYS